MHKQPLKSFRFPGPVLAPRPSVLSPDAPAVDALAALEPVVVAAPVALVVRSTANSSLPFSRSPFFNREWTPSCRAPRLHGGLPSPSSGAPEEGGETQRCQGPPLAQPCVARCLRWSHRRTQRSREACQRTSPSDYQGAPPVRRLVEPPSALLWAPQRHTLLPSSPR